MEEEWSVAHNMECKLTAVKTEVSAASACDNDVTEWGWLQLTFTYIFGDSITAPCFKPN